MVYVGVSGGIDSSFALYILKKQYKEICAVFLLFKSIDSTCPLKCCNFENVILLTKKLDVPLKIIDAREIFKNEVINYFLDEYKNGKTPNPCIICNEKVKFRLIFENLLNENDFVATGHYARISKENEDFYLKKGIDFSKEQSYMLYRLKKEYLKKIIFPLGDFYKKDVIKEFEKLKIFQNIPKESQDLCFIKKDKNLFLKEIFGERNGKIVHVNGKIIGEHKGYYFYTIGQRSGLNISWREPLYVIDIDNRNNLIYVGEIEYAYKEKFVVNNLNWLIDLNKVNLNDLKVKTRYKGKELPCSIEFVENRLIVNLKEKEFAITPGQSAVFYKDEYVVGGGEIEKVL
jgi:tRNA-specific 2-thiouridylase